MNRDSIGDVLGFGSGLLTAVEVLGYERVQMLEKRYKKRYMYRSAIWLKRFATRRLRSVFVACCCVSLLLAVLLLGGSVFAESSNGRSFDGFLSSLAMILIGLTFGVLVLVFLIMTFAYVACLLIWLFDRILLVFSNKQSTIKAIIALHIGSYLIRLGGRD